MRTQTAWKLSAPSLAEFAISASMLFHPNVFVVLLAPLMCIALVLLIAAVAMASKKHQQTSKGAWRWLAVGGVAQVMTFMVFAAVAKRT